MTLRNILLLVFALVAAAGTALVARGWINAERAAMMTRPKPAPVEPGQFVLVAKVNLPTGRFVRADDFRWQGWPDGALPPGYIVRGKRAPDELVGSVVRAAVTAGEPVTDAKLVKPGDRGFMAAVLQPGMRAVSIAVTATSGIAGFVFPGDRVDVLLTHTVPTDPAAQRKAAVATETVLRDVRVLAIDQRTDDQDNKPLLAKTVTLEATPKQAEMLRVTGSLGALSLTLRSLADEPASDAPAPALVAALEQGSSDGAIVPLPAEGRFTLDAEVSRLLGGPGARQRVTVMRGAKSVDQAFRDGQPEPAADPTVAPGGESEAAARSPEEIVQ